MLNSRFTHEDLRTLFNLRVLLRYDEKFSTHVAHCVETGNVVTAESAEQATEMMKELLEDEISFALRHRNLKNLFSSPAPIEVLMQWVHAAQSRDPETVFLDVDFKELEGLEIEPKNAGLKNKVEFANAA
jgi:hypothetical protein